jgi:quercetin dioxygenase-like cupin family protein
MSGLAPIRRVVTGHDARRRSRVLFDGPAPNVNPRAVSAGAGMTDVWVFERCPANVTGERDDGRLPFSFEPPEHGGHLRIVQSLGRAPGYDPAKDTGAVPVHEPRQRPGGTWDRGGQNAYSSPIHRSATVDYGIVLEGERVLRLDDGERVMRPGDVVVQLGNWHGWTNPRAGSSMAFVMMGATLEGRDRVSAGRAVSTATPPAGVRPVRRIVTVDDEHGASFALDDGPCPDAYADPARPGFSATRIWMTDRTPARVGSIEEISRIPLTPEPPAGGSVCWIVTLPPEASSRERIGARMERRRTLDLCLVLDGEVTLVLDEAEVPLQAGDTVVQRATSHAWRNRSSRPAVLAISSHDARA